MRRPLLFGLVGLANTAIDFLVFLALARLLGLDPLTAGAVGYLAGATHSYLANGLLTFRDRRVPLLEAGRIGRFVLVTVLCLGLSTVTMAVALPFMPDVTAKACGVLVTFAAGYLLNHRLVYVTWPRHSAPRA